VTKKTSERKVRRMVSVVEQARDKCMAQFKTRNERRACVIGAQLAAGVLVKGQGL